MPTSTTLSISKACLFPNKKVNKSGFTLIRTRFASLTKPCQGFTLIELMVAIAIVAIMATVGLVVYSSAQKSGRISKRMQDLEALKTALELYKSSTGNYPVAPTPGTFACIATPLAGLAPNYMPTLPSDPLDGGNPAGTNCYEYTSNSSTAATEYKIRTKANIAAAASGPEMSSAQFLQQPNLIDPARDGTAGCTVETGATVTGWSVYSGSTACAYNTP